MYILYIYNNAKGVMMPLNFFNYQQLPVFFNGNFNSYSTNNIMNPLLNQPMFNFGSNLYIDNRENSSVSSKSEKNDKYANEKSNFQFSKSLPQNSDATETTLQVGEGAEKIKGYYAKNPETGDVVYADQYGQRFTKEAFENWEQFAKDGTFAH